MLMMTTVGAVLSLLLFSKNNMSKTCYIGPINKKNNITDQCSHPHVILETWPFGSAAKSNY